MNVSIPVGNVDCAGVVTIMCDRQYLGVGVENNINEAKEKYQDGDAQMDVLH